MNERTSFWRFALICFLVGSGVVTVGASRANGQSTSVVSTNNYSAGVEFFSLAPYPLPAKGVRFGALFGTASEMELTYVESEKKVLLADYKFSDAELRLTHFLGSLVQFGYGLSVRTVQLGYNTFLTGETEETHFNENHRAIAGNVHLGIEVTAFDIITLGSDLLNVSRPLYWTKDTNEFPATAAEGEEDPKDFPYVATGFGQHMQFLRTYLKVRF